MTQIDRWRNPRRVLNGSNPSTGAKLIAVALAVLLLSLLGLVVAAWADLPHWRVDGTNSTYAASVTHLPGPLPCPGAGAGIAIIGDSHVAGSRMEGGGMPFGEVLERQLLEGVRVMRHGIGGETAASAEQRWQGRDLNEANLVILALGTNDAAPRGWLSDKAPVPLPDYKASLTRQIAGWRARGSEVALLAPPPGGSAAMTARLAPYRKAAREVGIMMNVATFDPADAFTGCTRDQPLLGRDALHMNAAGHRCLGRWLARQFCPVLR